MCTLSYDGLVSSMGHPQARVAKLRDGYCVGLTAKFKLNATGVPYDIYIPCLHASPKMNYSVS